MTDSLWEKIQETAGPRASQEALQGNRDEKGFAVSLVYLWKSVPCAFNYLLIFFFKCSIKSTAAGCCVSWDTEESEPEPGGGRMRLPSLHGLFQKVRLWNVLHEALRRLWEARPVPQAWGFCKPDRRVSQKKAAPPLHKKIPVRVHFPQPVSVSGYKLLSLALPLPSQLSSDLLLSPPAPCSSPRLFLPLPCFPCLEPPSSHTPPPQRL